jgi:hypothetical protein
LGTAHHFSSNILPHYFLHFKTFTLKYLIQTFFLIAAPHPCLGGSHGACDSSGTWQLSESLCSSVLVRYPLRFLSSWVWEVVIQFKNCHPLRVGISATFFAIFINDLAEEIKQTGVGLNSNLNVENVNFDESLLINILMFSDEIVLLTEKETDMQFLLYLVRFGAQNGD